MTRPRPATAAPDRRMVLICESCRYAFEPLWQWTAEHLQALADGCPECGDWLYLGELVDPDPRGNLQ
jgi:hypothetical protein